MLLVESNNGQTRLTFEALRVRIDFPGHDASTDAALDPQLIRICVRGTDQDTTWKTADTRPSEFTDHLSTVTRPTDHTSRNCVSSAVLGLHVISEHIITNTPVDRFLVKMAVQELCQVEDASNAMRIACDDFSSRLGLSMPSVTVVGEHDVFGKEALVRLRCCVSHTADTHGILAAMSLDLATDAILFSPATLRETCLLQDKDRSRIVDSQRVLAVKDATVDTSLYDFVDEWLDPAMTDETEVRHAIVGVNPTLDKAISPAT